ncbi:hypothetical protein [Gilliamella apis]|uniref:hypothetical protein n=1 Tax=Gilliamella apis TaxID=1970738 RepID=UPI000A35AC10|nr:hypothetical protein [Gilliamella apis]OTQ35065.1 hypothetical protein B6C84_07225 [Gilliamella apis]OTQ36032.1 hypothetical protein B6C88_08785 [Gilliamella apis]OTQ41533.1 hypothetical protein B6D26_02165 [Gilliamella apis]OTQ43717.1 hypothetical protein B6C94_01260 [Gilliamella apis]OTQ51050.1 hypothetical protein B6C92_07520 [Gilliamella apis]
MVFALTVVVLLSISFSNYALTTKTANIIQGSAPYFTFDGGRTQTTNTDGLLRISLSNGDIYTPTTTNSRDNPIILPVAGQSFADIGMLVPTNTDSIELSSVIGPPNNYWGDDDGDGQDADGIIATGSLMLSIVDKNNQAVSRNTVLSVCNAPYKLTLSNSEGTLKTRYGVPNESRFITNSVTYYVSPKIIPVICFARPDMNYASGNFAGPSAIWDPKKGFLPQSVMSSSYDLNFPTTGAHNLYFDLEIGGSNQALSWEPVTHDGITATMTNSTKTSVRVTLTGPVTTESQWKLINPGNIDKPSLPQVFELVGRDSSGNAVVKYGFVLKQWFVNRGPGFYNYSRVFSWCIRIGVYGVPKVKNLTNANCHRTLSCQSAAPTSPDKYMRRHIGAGFFTEWGNMADYAGANFTKGLYWTSDGENNSHIFVLGNNGYLNNTMRDSRQLSGLCVYP